MSQMDLVPAIEPGEELATVTATAAPDHLSERPFLERLRQGDEAAFEELVRRESGHLLAVARRFLGHDDDAQDAVQQAFLCAFRALPRFNGHCRLTTWLHRIVTNVSLMKIRTRGRRPEQSIEELLPNYLEDGHHAEPISEWCLGAEERLLRNETRARVRAAVDRLPNAYRTVLLMRDIEELDTQETARALGLSDGAVKTRLHRARQALATLLQSALAPALD
jgi:RNA polymerase sigma-70 factor, ECF subfamily